MAKTLLTNEQSVWLGKDPSNKVSHERILFGRAKTNLIKYHMSVDCFVGQRPFNKVSHERILFGMAKTLLTKYHMNADCLVGLRPF